MELNKKELAQLVMLLKKFLGVSDVQESADEEETEIKPKRGKKPAKVELEDDEESEEESEEETEEEESDDEESDDEESEEESDNEESEDESDDEESEDESDDDDNGPTLPVLRAHMNRIGEKGDKHKKKIYDLLAKYKVKTVVKLDKKFYAKFFEDLKKIK